MTDEAEREEWLDKKLAEAKDADTTPIAGKKSSVATIQDRTYKAFERQPDNVARALPDMDMGVEFLLPDIRKRTAAERSLSLGSRLWKAALQNPAEMQLLLQRIQSHLWQQGRTVAFDDIKRVADELIAVAEKKEKEAK